MRGESSATSLVYPAAAKPPRAIPIGVFDSAFDSLSLEEMLDKLSALGIEAVEIRAKGLPDPSIARSPNFSPTRQRPCLEKEIRRPQYRVRLSVVMVIPFTQIR